MMDSELRFALIEWLAKHDSEVERRVTPPIIEIIDQIIAVFEKQGYRKVRSGAPPLVPNPWIGDIDIFNNIRLATRQGFDEGIRKQRDSDVRFYNDRFMS